MFSPINPQTVYIVHKEKERELEQRIEMIRIAKEQSGEVAWGAVPARSQGWYAAAAQWVKVNLIHRAPVVERAAVAAEALGEPCHGVPC